MHLDLQGPAGRLEALWEEAPEPRAAAVVCHPHPRFGGTMHTHAVHRIARAARGAGISTLRFQFRGVGRSSGAHDDGRGEVGDVQAALGWLAGERPALPRLLAGFSFGAWMALEAAGAEPAVRGVLCAGLAVRALPSAAARACAAPVAVVQAERDEYGPPAEVEAALRGARGPRRVAVVHGASHLFAEDLGTLEHRAREAFTWLLAHAE